MELDGIKMASNENYSNKVNKNIQNQTKSNLNKTKSNPVIVAMEFRTEILSPTD